MSAWLGRGLYSVFVTEVIHLNPASRNNQNNQENGRAARLLPIMNADLQVGYINVDLCSEYACYTGERIMDAMDDLPPLDEPPEEKERNLSELPEDPSISILDMRCIKIDRGEVRRMALVLSGLVREWHNVDLEDESHPIHKAAEDEYRKMRQREADLHNENSTNLQWREQVDRAVNVVVNSAIKLLIKNGARFERTLVGDLKKRVQQRRVKEFRTLQDSSVEDLQAQYQWLVRVQKSIIGDKANNQPGELPSWLR